jgi:hypothetical protein
MPWFPQFAGQMAGVITLLAFAPYIISMVRGHTKPNRATWWILVIVGVMLAASYRSVGAKNTIWVPVSFVVGPLAIALLSLKYGEGGWSKFDRYCVLGALIASAFWLFQGALAALLINLATDWLGLMPTVRKAYWRPHTENKFAWVAWFIGSTLNLFAVEEWKFELAVYPVYMFVGNGILVLLVCWPRSKSR